MISKIATRTFSTAKKIYRPEQMKAVVAKTAGTVEKTAAITLGPYGRNVLIQNEMQEPRITKDGVTVVKHIEFVSGLAHRKIEWKMLLPLSSKRASTARTSLPVMEPPPQQF